LDNGEKMINEKIAVLKKNIVKYSQHVEQMVVKSCTGIFEGNDELLREVVEKSECIANKYEIEFDEICIDYIAQYQPIAKNLRILISVVKMSSILERMADHAVNIAEIGFFLILQPQIKPFADLPKMSVVTTQMLRDSINSFVNENANLAQEALKRDNEIDDFKLRITNKLINIMEKDSNTVSRAVKLINIAANLERIADLATNICECSIYLSQGLDVKHRGGTD
jgi:phosphate transport system protein